MGRYVARYSGVGISRQVPPTDAAFSKIVTFSKPARSNFTAMPIPLIPPPMMRIRNSRATRGLVGERLFAILLCHPRNAMNNSSLGPSYTLVIQ